MWCYDFVFDHCANGQQLKCLTVADEFTKEGLAIDTLGSAELVIAGSAAGGAKRSRYFKTLANEFGAWVLDQGRVTSARGWPPRCAPSPTPAARC